MKDLVIKVVLYWVVFSLLLLGYAQADSGFYIEGGLAYQATGLGKPEYTASNPLGDLGLGYTFDLGDWDLDFYVKHRSSIPDTENGIGQNFVGLKFRKYLK